MLVCTYTTQMDNQGLINVDVIHAPPETSRQSETYPTVASISEQRRAQSRSQPPPPTNDAQSTQVTAAPDAQPTAPGSPEQLEEEAGQEGAFNEETGEINWDCPCLGGMAHGPCGEQFRAAFSCFVFSKEEPKGVDCIEHFKTMQNCFREHPDVYGAELDDDEEPSTDGVEGQSAPASSQPAPAPQAAQVESTPSQGGESAAPKVQKGSDQEPVEHLGETKSDINRSVAAQIPMQRHMENDTDEELVPKAWHDSRDANNTQGTKQSS